MTITKCPNCGARVEVALFLRQRTAHRHQFESTQATPPGGGLRSLLWFLRGHTPAPRPSPAHVTVKVESWDYANNRVTFKELDSRITYRVVCEIAEMLAMGLDWTRENLTRYTSLNENRVRVYQSEFKHIGYLEVTPNNRSIVTPPGRRFFHGCLTMKNHPAPNTSQHTRI